jgi:hypothetical protein
MAPILSSEAAIRHSRRDIGMIEGDKEIDKFVVLGKPLRRFRFLF